MCVCDEGFSGHTCDLSKAKRQAQRTKNTVLIDAIWTSLDTGVKTCPILHNTLKMIVGTIHGDLDRLTTDDLLGLLERISSTFLQPPVCLELIEGDLHELLGLIPAYIHSERSRSRKDKQKRNNGDRSDKQRRLEESVNVGNNKLAAIKEFLATSLERLNLQKLNISVPGEAPAEIRRGGVTRLTSVNNVASPASMCTEDETSCATYPSNSVRCSGDHNQFGIAMVGESAFFT